MRAAEILIFRDFSSLEEPALMTPLGFMSLRNILVIAVFGIMTATLYHTIVPENMRVTADWPVLCIVFVPLLIGVILAVTKTPFGSSDAVLLCIMTLAVRRLAARQAGKKKKTGQKKMTREPSELLGLPHDILQVAMSASGKAAGKTTAAADMAAISEYTREIMCSDLDELKSIRITIHAGDGSIMADTLVRCYLDDEMFDTLRTSAEGVIILHVRPEHEGGRTLTITTDNDDQAVILRRRLQFVQRRS